MRYYERERGLFAAFRLLATVVSLAIVLPCALLKDYKAVVLGFSVFVLTRFVESVARACKGGCGGVMHVMHVFECLLDVFALGCCFFYLAAFMGLCISCGDLEAINTHSYVSTNSYMYVIMLATALYVTSDLFSCLEAFYVDYKAKLESVRVATFQR